MAARDLIRFICLLWASAVLAPEVGAQKVYWTTPERVQRADPDGSNLETVVPSGPVQAVGIAVDPVNGKVYWTDSVAGKIQRANLDGTGVETLVAGFMDPWGIDLDVPGGKMYWTVPGLDRIRRADLDGNNVEDIVSGLSFPAKISLDAAAGKVYWTDNYANSIQRANLDGSEVEELITDLGETSGIALDVTAEKIYWTDNFLKKIYRADFDGGGIEELLYWPGGILAIDVDLIARKMYWTDYTTGEILRADLDGNNVEYVVRGLTAGPYGIALDPTTRSFPCAQAGSTGYVVYSNDFEEPGDPLSEWSNTSTEVTPVGERTFLGRFSSEIVSLTLTGIPDHDLARVTCELFVVGSWNGNEGPSTPDVWGLTADRTVTLLQTTFGGAGSRQAYPDTFPAGDHPGRSGAESVDSLGYTQDSVYYLDFIFVHSGSSLVVDFAGLGLGDLEDESWGLDNVAVQVFETGAGVVYSNDFEDGGDPLSEWSSALTETTPVGARRFLGRFSDDSVSLTLSDLPEHDTVTVAFDSFVINSWDGNDPTFGPDVWGVQIDSGPVLLHTTFADQPEITQAYPDRYPGGEYPGQTGAVEVNTLGYSVDSVYHVEVTFPHASDMLVLEFAGVGLEGVGDESWGLDNVVVSVTACTGEGIPTITEWGMVVMALLVATTGTLIFAKRPRRRDVALYVPPD